MTEAAESGRKAEQEMKDVDHDAPGDADASRVWKRGHEDDEE